MEKRAARRWNVEVATLKGFAAIGHTRYSTTGSSVLRNVQPMHCDCGFGPVALAHNGDLINAASIRERMISEGIGILVTLAGAVLIGYRSDFTLSGFLFSGAGIILISSLISRLPSIMTPSKSFQFGSSKILYSPI